MIHIYKYGDKRDYKKIYLYDKTNGRLLACTTWASSCRLALEKFNYKNARASYK